MIFDIIFPDSVLEMGVSTNLNCSPIEGQVFRGSIVTHKFAEAIAHVLSICTFQLIGCIETTLVAIDLAGNIAPKVLTLKTKSYQQQTSCSIVLHQIVCRLGIFC